MQEVAILMRWRRWIETIREEDMVEAATMDRTDEPTVEVSEQAKLRMAISIARDVSKHLFAMENLL